MKKTCITLLLFLAVLSGGFAQSKPLLTPKQLEKGNYQTLEAYLQPTDEDGPEIEEYPKYPGGLQGLTQDLASHIKYPKKARKQGITGQVVITFVIEKDGTIGEPEVVKGVHPELDAAAVSAVKQLKQFHPGFAGGKPSRIMYTLPVRFALN